MYWLPPANETFRGESVYTLLNKRYGIDLKPGEPDWVREYVLPRQQETEARVQTLDAERQSLQEAALHEGRFCKLLYGHEDELEEIVNEALQQLGARIEEVAGGNFAYQPPGQTGFEEYRVVAERGMIKQDSIDAYLQYRTSPLPGQGSKVRPLLIGNPQYDQPLSKRQALWTEATVRSAEAAGITLLTTAQLFQALVMFQRDQEYATTFWRVLQEEAGVCGLPFPETQEGT